MKESEITTDVFGFLTTEPNATVGVVYPKAMPVILTTAEELDVRMRAESPKAKALQRSLPDGVPEILVCGHKKDPSE